MPAVVIISNASGQHFGSLRGGDRRLQMTDTTLKTDAQCLRWWYMSCNWYWVAHSPSRTWVLIPARYRSGCMTRSAAETRIPDLWREVVILRPTSPFNAADTWGEKPSSGSSFGKPCFYNTLDWQHQLMRTGHTSLPCWNQAGDILMQLGVIFPSGLG